MLRKMILAGLIVVGTQLHTKDATSNSAATASPGAPQGIRIDLGKEDFRTYCAACHGVGGKGDGTIAEFLTIAAADLTGLTKLNSGIFPRERVMHVIDGRDEVKVHGARDMPVWGDWFDREAISADVDRDARELIVRDRIESLITYIETLQEK